MTAQVRGEKRREESRRKDGKDKEERGEKKGNGKRKDEGNIVMEVRIEEIS